MRAILCAILFALCAPAQAAVYVWETVSASERWPWFEGRIEFANDWTEYEHDIVCVAELEWCLVADPDSPVLRFQFASEHGLSIDLRPRTGEGWLYDVPGLEIGADTLLANTGGTDVFMRREGGLWSVLWFGSDEFNPSCGADCEGATGRWVLQQATVPTPGTLALLATAALLAATARRARAARAATPTSRGWRRSRA